MRARRFVPLMAAAFLLVPALPASAHIGYFVITGAAGGDAGHPGEWRYTEVFGAIRCEEGERFLVTAKVIDDSFIGKGRTKGTCSGQLQSWRLSLEHQSGFGDRCWEVVAAKAHTKINGVDHAEETDGLPPNCA